MKLNLVTTITAISICSITLADAKPNKRKVHRRAQHVEKRAENAAMREEALLDKKDTHRWSKDPTARDHRPENIREYTNHTHHRIIRLGTLGALEEKDQQAYSKAHTDIINFAKNAKSDGLDKNEIQSIRKKLDDLNDSVNASVKKAETDSNRTPIVNRAQHEFMQKIEFGERSGRLSTLEASSLRRKADKLERLEDRLKGGNGLSSSERERLMKELHEIQRELRKELTD